MTFRPFRVDVPEKRSSICAAASRRRVGPTAETVADDVAGRAARDDAGARALLGDGLRLAQGRGAGSTRCRSSSPRSTDVDIHFIHVRSKHDGRAADHRHARVARLDHRAARRSSARSPTRRPHGGKAADAFDVVIPSLPGHGFSGKPTDDRLGPGPRSRRAWIDADAAPRLHALRGAGRRLGQCRLGADGAAGATGTARHPHQHAGHRARPRSRRRSRLASPPPAGLSPTRSNAWDQLDFFYKQGSAMPRRWATVRRRCTRSRIRRSGWPPGCSTTTRAATDAHRPRLRRPDRRA